MTHPRVLFVCTYQGGRARVAAELARKLSSGTVHADSACFEKFRIGDLPITVMNEVGITITSEPPPTVFDRYRVTKRYDYVITLCYTGTSERCPDFNFAVKQLFGKHGAMLAWSIRDFNSIGGAPEERLATAREIRDEIEAKVIAFLEDLGVLAGRPVTAGSQEMSVTSRTSAVPIRRSRK